MFIVNPMNALQARGRGGITSLFRTHPPTEARVERLRAIASELRGERGPIG
jgi:Zn-dependent protease with chaperone function